MVKKTAAFCGLILLTMFTTYAQSFWKTMKRLPDTKQTLSYTPTFGEDADYNFNTPYFNTVGGTATDTITGLMWQRADGGEMTFDQAVHYADTLTLGGYTDWRLANAHELFSIMHLDRTNPALDTNVFTKNTADYWWSSTLQTDDASKVWVSNAGGGIGNHPKTETISAGGNKRFHTRAVRSVYTPLNLAQHFINNQNGTITDAATGLIWTAALAQDTMTWENALVYAASFLLADNSDWRLPNIKELQSINDETLVNPSLNTGFFNVATNQKYWSSTTLPNQAAKAWYLDSRYGITTYANKTARLLVLLVSGNGQVNDPTPPPATDSSSLITIYPNPTSATLNIKLSSTESILHYELFSSAGQMVLTGKEKNILTGHLQRGAYSIRITTDKRTISKNIIIQ